MHLPDFQSTHVLVVGDVMLDRYWHGATTRISPEAPVPIVHVDGAEERPGGAGNVALNVASLGGRASLLAYCGRDEAADSLADLLQNAGVRCAFEKPRDRGTVTKLRVISRQQQLIRLDFEDGFHGVDHDGLIQRFAKEVGQANVVVFSDYGKGTLETVQQLIAMARQAGKLILVDPKGKDFARYRGATLLTPNMTEFEAVAGHCSSDEILVEKGLNLINALDLDALLVTRGEQGMTLLRQCGESLHLPTHAKEVFDVTGAGDTVIAVLAAVLAAGRTLPEATALANMAAGVVVGKLGTASIAPEELEYAFKGPRAHRRGVLTLEELPEILEQARLDGECIVATNGCFDILHAGHVQYLQQAKELGDRLVVLVNSDASVARLKGPERPINPLAQRMAMLAALECVDWVAPFDADTPEDAICRILPDVLVKGGDYRSPTDIVGYECVIANGGEVRVLDYVAGYSTTSLIASIRNG
ncbi:MAG: bifunctional D-glycero-beta-D-manno-heptose-7-phosphate kinase/D-glycero-beta-D-manno-heptose 1-phosphate adenylyltransferase HldE [Methylococcaceae bacterium]|nr:MAG: bifunctional D-glycero-beta-D-manno-heptose-7-phosphate kinase/D-glycero-beta-D-manno-heptose 1-phosphate adenylyltransferase HldE [Methylococcaceae bacterium]